MLAIAVVAKRKFATLPSATKLEKNKRKSISTFLMKLNHTFTCLMRIIHEKIPHMLDNSS